MLRKIMNILAPDAAKPVSLVTGKSAYMPAMVKRPTIGVDSVAHYFLDAQMLAVNSVAGGGTIPRGNPPRALAGAGLAPQMIGAPIQDGTIARGLRLDPLVSRSMEPNIIRGGM